MTKKRLLMTIGLPRSGKSTWCKKQRYPIVNPDSIRRALHGQAFIKEAESIVWSIALYMVRALFLAGHNKVILDATNLDYFRRKEWFREDCSLEYYLFNTKAEICKERAIANNQSELIEVIDRMAKETLDFELDSDYFTPKYTTICDENGKYIEK